MHKIICLIALSSVMISGCVSETITDPSDEEIETPDNDLETGSPPTISPDVPEEDVKCGKGSYTVAERMPPCTLIRSKCIREGQDNALEKVEIHCPGADLGFSKDHIVDPPPSWSRSSTDKP